MTYGFNNDSTPCLPCPNEMYSANGSHSCSFCPSGFVFNSIDPWSQPCVKCPASKFSSLSEPPVCESCPQGKFSEEGWSLCLPNRTEAYKIGCADGEREWFINVTTHPVIAGCSGAFRKKGIKKQNTVVNNDVTCANTGGDDGPFPLGEECSASDLCAEGWHLCSDAVEVYALSGTGDCDYDGHMGDEELFFATGQSSSGNSVCKYNGADDVFGCGTMLENSELPCGPLDKIFKSTSSTGGSWKSSLSSMEAFDIQKLRPENGGVLCCRNVSCTSCSTDQICIPKQSGCSDGTREWFIDSGSFPNIAGCAGAFVRPGLIQNNSEIVVPTCERKSGNDGVYTDGEACSASDLCESGWKICDSFSLIKLSSGGSFCDPSEVVRNPSNSLFLSFDRKNPDYYRFIRISRVKVFTGHFMNLLEVEVYSDGKNVALGKSLVTSIPQDHWYFSSIGHLVDGDENTLAHSTDENFEWFLIDLGDVYHIQKVVITYSAE